MTAEHRFSPTPGYFNYEGVSVNNIDFSQPWSRIVREINQQIANLGYQALNPNFIHRFWKSNLDGTEPENRNCFDFVRISLNPLNENYSPVIRFVAKLGVQGTFWQDLATVLSSYGDDRLALRHYNRFGCIPVFYLNGSSYFLGARKNNSLYSFNLTGDADMIGRMEEDEFPFENNTLRWEKLGIN